MKRVVCLALLVLFPASGRGQTLTHRGFVEGTALLFPQETPIDPERVVGDVLARAEAFYTPAGWVQVAAGLDFRANSHGQVADDWQPDLRDRGALRPRLSVRRLSATLIRGGVTLDVGRQFVRWGKTDIVTPTDWFAPRDYLNVVDNDFLAVGAVRGVAQFGGHAIDVVWAPRFTPSRVPLFDQRWSGLPDDVTIPVVDAGASLPSGGATGVRWSHIGDRAEFALSYFDGFNHLPSIHSDFTPQADAVRATRRFAPIRALGADLAAPVPWFTVKAEAAFSTSTERLPEEGTADDYVLYVVQLERQTGEWVFVGGYAGEIITTRRTLFSFAPDRGLSRALVARASYTIDTNRSFGLEGAVRQNGGGFYAKGEYSQAYGQHWRATFAGIFIGGEEVDFLGQYRRNSHAILSLRYSF